MVLIHEINGLKYYLQLYKGSIWQLNGLFDNAHIFKNMEEINMKMPYIRRAHSNAGDFKIKTI